MLPKTAGSAQTHKNISFIWIVWSTLYMYTSDCHTNQKNFCQNQLWNQWIYPREINYGINLQKLILRPWCTNWRRCEWRRRVQRWRRRGATPVQGGSRKFSMRHSWGDFTIEWSLFYGPGCWVTFQGGKILLSKLLRKLDEIINSQVTTFRYIQDPSVISRLAKHWSTNKNFIQKLKSKSFEYKQHFLT